MNSPPAPLCFAKRGQQGKRIIFAFYFCLLSDVFCLLSRNDCRIIDALILSTIDLSCRPFFLTPPSIIVLSAIPEVNLSSTLLTGISREQLLQFPDKRIYIFNRFTWLIVQCHGISNNKFFNRFSFYILFNKAFKFMVSDSLQRRCKDLKRISNCNSDSFCSEVDAEYSAHQILNIISRAASERWLYSQRWLYYYSESLFRFRFVNHRSQPLI